MQLHLVHTNRAPQDLVDCGQTVAQSSSRPGLRSADTAVYVKPSTRTKFCECGFHFTRPAAWNSLLDQLHCITDLIGLLVSSGPSTEGGDGDKLSPSWARVESLPPLSW